MLYAAERKAESDARAGRRLVGSDRYAAAVLFDDRLGEKQPQADTFALGREKRLENPSRDLLFNPAAAIGEGQDQIAVVAAEIDRQPPAIGHCLHRVDDDVDEAGAQLLGVNVQSHAAGVAALDEFDRLATELGFAEREHA